MIRHQSRSPDRHVVLPRAGAVAIFVLLAATACGGGGGSSGGGGGSGGSKAVDASGSATGGAGGSGGTGASGGSSGADVDAASSGGGGSSAGSGAGADGPSSDLDAAATDSATGGDVDTAAAAPDGAAAVPPGMTKLFDGTSLTGWDGNPAIWSVNATDGAIHGKTGNGGQLINTKDSYQEFRLLVTARMLIMTTNHMGICFWGTPATPGKWSYNGCLDLMPPWGGLWDYQSNKSLLAPPGDQSIQAQWMQIELLVLSTGQVLAAINGVQTTDKMIPGRARMSPIGLQAHAGASDQEYKDIYVEPNPAVHTLMTVKH